MTQNEKDEPGESVVHEEEDPILEEILHDSLGPLMAELSPEELADHRRVLTMFIKTHPAAAPRYERLRAGRIAVLSSGDTVKEGDDAVETREVKGDGTFGGPGK
jgi:hypothetical protein